MNTRKRITFWLLTLLMLGVVALFLRLAVWQFQRGQARAARLQAYAAARHGPPSPLPATGIAALPLYAHVTAAGRYEADRQIVLIERPRPHGQKIGAEVLTPLRLADGQLLLVNRGWVGADAEGHTSADLVPPVGEVRVSGHLSVLDRAGLRLGDGEGRPGHWPKYLLYPAWPDLEKLYGPGLVHRVLWLAPDEPGGYARNWEYRPARGPQENYSYMAQWIGLAVTVFIVWLVLTLRALPRSHGEDRR